MKKMIALLVLMPLVMACETLGGTNETFYDSTTTTTEYETDEVSGERVVASITVDDEQIRGETAAGPFSKITGEVGTTIVVNGEDGGYTFDSAGKADIEGELGDVVKSLGNSLASVGIAQAAAPSGGGGPLENIANLLAVLQQFADRFENLLPGLEAVAAEGNVLAEELEE